MLATGCSPTALPIHAQPGELIIWVATQTDGTPLAGISDVGPTVFELADVARLAFFNVPAEGLIDDAGPLGPAVLPGLAVRTPQEQSGVGCGRCLAASPTWPQALFPGDLCPLPAQAPGRFFVVDGGAALEEPEESSLDAGLRSLVRLARPGDCACPLRERPPLEPNFEPAAFQGASVPLRGFALAGDGTAYGFLPGRVWRRSATGEISSAVDPLPSSQVPQAATELRDGSLLVARLDREHPEELTNLFHYTQGPAGWTFETILVPDKLKVSTLRRDPDDPYVRTIVAGRWPRIGSEFGGVAICSTDLNCESVQLDPPTVNGVRGVEVRSDGVLHVYTDEEVYSLERPNGRWHYRAARRTLAFEGLSYEVEGWNRLRFGAQRVFGCANLVDDGKAIVAMPYDASGVPDPEGMEVLALSAARSVCGGLFERANGQVYAWIDGPAPVVLELDAQGQILSRGADPGLVAPASSLLQLEPGKLLGRDEGGGLYLGDGPETLAKIYGEADPHLGDVMALLPDGDRLVVVTVHGRLRVVGPSGITVIADPEGRVPARLSLWGATLDLGDPGPGYRLVGADLLGLVELRFDQEVRSFRRLDVAIDAPQVVAWSRPGTFLVGSNDGRLYSLREGNPPELLPLGFGTGDDPGLASAQLVHSHGVVLGVGDSGPLLRAVGPRLESFQPDTVGLSYRRLSAPCPDRVFVAANGDQGRGVARLVPGARGPKVQLDRAPSLAGSVVAVLEDGDDFAFLDVNGQLHRPSGIPTIFALWSEPRVAFGLPEVVVIGGDQGTLYVEGR